MAGIHRRRPGADAIAPAQDVPAVPIADGIWMSPGVANSYALATDEGRVIVNAGLNFEGPIRRRAFDAVCPGPTRAIVLTQGHPDHFGGVAALRDEATDVVMQANHRIWRADHERLLGFRARNAAFAWAHTMDAIVANLASLPPEQRQLTFPEPTVVVGDRLELTIGGRRLVLISTPGGETTDSLVVWLPDEATVFTGNLFGPLFGHVPNLVTMRGDRYRDALEYVASAGTVLALGARRLVTGHFDPVEGADLIAEEVAALRDSTQWVHDRTVEGMERGDDVFTLMRDIRLPDRFDVGEGYGKVSWNVRAIWETYAGWFHHRSTTELYAVPPDAVAADLVAAAGEEALVAAARGHLADGRPVEALHLTDVVLAARPGHPGAVDVAVAAHEALLEDCDNFWERAWLRRAIDKLGGGA